MLQFPIVPSVHQYVDSLRKIEVLTAVLLHLPLETRIHDTIFHRQLLKSSLFSARIEGNQLTLAQATNLDQSSPNKNKREISNVMKALKKIPSYDSTLSISVLREIHTIVTDKLLPDSGKLRHESSAIYDQYGTVVYLTPSPDEMNRMLAVFFEQATTQKTVSWQEQLLLIAASHYYFEKIHPFLDGNGRTGRVIMHYQLFQTGLFGKSIIPLDQFFDEHKSEYYDLLEKNTRKIDSFIAFFLEGIIYSLEMYLIDVKTSLSTPEESQINTSLLPRRQELYEIIKDHPYISLDALSRRFPTIPKRTISYDVNNLVKEKLVIKHGQTRGVVYSAS